MDFPYNIRTDFEFDSFDYYSEIDEDRIYFGESPIRRNIDTVSHTIDSFMPEIESNYDQQLTSAHKYLGDGLRESYRRSIFEEGIIHQIPVLYLKSNLVPGQIFPLIGRSVAVKELLKYSISRNRVFGVCYKGNTKLSTFGTIAEIYAYTGDYLTSSTIRVKAMGQQRYEILKTEPFPGSSFLNEINIALAQIRIISDVSLPVPYTKTRKRDMLQTQWPAWVYKQFDTHYLVKRIAEKVKVLYNKVKISDDPYLLSLQLTRLGIFNQEQVSHMLGMESTNLRLQQELYLWEKYGFKQKFMCSKENCNTCVCDLRNVFPMSPDGPHGMYCNALGKVHNMITVNELDFRFNVIMVGHPSDECSWFPGYSWTIFLCQNCRTHLGWRFTITSDRKLTPNIFYGLSLSAITSDKTYIPCNPNDDTMDFLDYAFQY